MTFVLIAILLLLAGTIYLWVRNDRVCEFRLLLLRYVTDAGTADIREGRDWAWRYDAFESVKYEKNLFSFKRLKVSNYWSDLSFVNNYDVTL